MVILVFYAVPLRSTPLVDLGGSQATQVAGSRPLFLWPIKLLLRLQGVVDDKQLFDHRGVRPLR